MALRKKREMDQTSPEFLENLEDSWECGEYLCPSCGKPLKIEEGALLQINSCKYCNSAFFMPKKYGDYYLYEPSGGGGMGSVYKAVSPRFPGRILAVKILARSERNNPPNIRALLNEADVSQQFGDSEYIVACLDNGYIDGDFFTVMPFIAGERLDKRIERLGKLSEDETLTILLHLLAAEQHIYRKGFLFRDMKPENVIINEYGYAVLLDFGLCISLEAARNPQDDFISGSPYYMPPERLLGEPEDAPSEIYSLGMVAYHALTGHTLYDADGLEALAKCHVSKIKISNASQMGGISPGLATIIEKMIRQKSEERQQSFFEVADELKQYMAQKTGKTENE